MQKIQGTIGFSIPVQTLTNSSEVKMTPAEVMAWQKHLPSDLGQSAKKVYHAISDCNKVNLDPKDRFEMLELFDTSVQYICQALSKHYVNQTSSLTAQQLTIASLAETMQQQMADGYKLVVEQSLNLHDSQHANILPIALHKIIQYFTQIILISYELYSIPPKGIWRELHLVYQYAEKKLLLKKNNLEEDYKRVLVLAATYPYQRRQNEQHAVYKATEVWAIKSTLRSDLPNAADPGFLVVDFNEDKPPMFLARGLIKFSESCKVLDVHALLEHIKTLLNTIEPNELHERIVHNQEPEFAVPSTVLRGIIKGWEIPLSRLSDRTTHDEKIQIAIGFLATHYYINGQHLFQPQAANEGSENFTLVFSSPSLQDGGSEKPTLNMESDIITSTPQETEKITSYPLYPCTLVSESPNGYGLTWPDNIYPPMQSGEIIALAHDEEPERTWEICAIRWLLHLAQSDFKIGVERLSKTAKAAAAQLIKDGKTSGYLARCLILETTLLVPAFPFKTGNHILLISENNTMQEVELTTLVDSTGIYGQFQYIAKHGLVDKPPSTPTSQAPPTPGGSPHKEPEKGDDIFDSVWSNL